MAKTIMVIGRIVKEEKRVLLYPTSDSSVVRDFTIGTITTPPEMLGGFHVIASLEEAAGLNEGDTVEYVPYGVNFGWFGRKIS